MFSATQRISVPLEVDQVEVASVDRGVATYKLTDAAEALVSKKVNPNSTKKEAWKPSYQVVRNGGKYFLTTDDHSFARGAIRRLLGWDTYMSFTLTSNAASTELEANLKKCRGRYIMSSTYRRGSARSVTFVHFEDKSDASLVYLSSNVETERSSFPTTTRKSAKFHALSGVFD